MNCPHWMPRPQPLIWVGLATRRVPHHETLPAAVGSALSSEGISTDNADRVDGHLAKESTDTSATCSWVRLQILRSPSLFLEWPGSPNGFYTLKS